MTAKKIDIGFGEWLKLSAEHGGAVAKLAFLNIGGVMVAALTLAMVMRGPWMGPLLVLGLGFAFFSALYYRYKRDLEDPPWYLEEAEE